MAPDRRETARFKVAAFDIFAEIDGCGPYMIMTHGLGANTHVFQPLTEIFQRTHTVVRIDWPGHGGSSLNQTGSPFSMPDLVDIMRAVMDHLAISAAVLVGHSAGGIASMMLASEAPERVLGLAVIGAGQTRAPPSASKTFTLQLAEEARAGRMRDDVDDKVHLNIPSHSPALSRALLRAITTSTSPEGYAQMCEALCADSHRDPDYGKIRCPTCIIEGTHDTISTIETNTKLLTAISAENPRVSRHTISTGHMMIIENAPAVAAGIRTMLAEIGM